MKNGSLPMKANQCPINKKTKHTLRFFRRGRSARRFSGLLTLTSLLSCGTVQVYQEPDEPVFRYQENETPSGTQTDSLNVVTFNIKKAEKIALASTELEALQLKKNVDVYLLQEMDEKGVETIAKNLGLNYLYIPVVYNTAEKKNVGNAILTKGRIAYPEKLLLPHVKPLSKGRRHVTIAEVTIAQKKILVYSVHTETVVMSSKKRMDQVEAIIAHARKAAVNYNYILIGGDFNTLFSKDSRNAVAKFKGNGFSWSTEAAGETASAFFGLLKPTHDYIFTQGLDVMHSSKITSSRSSDHFPILATLRFQQESMLTAKRQGSTHGAVN